MQLVRFTPLLLLAAAAACGSEPGTNASASSTSITPTAGWLTVRLITPHTNDGAVQLAVTGPTVDSVAMVGYDGFAARTDDAVDIVVDGAIVSGDIARIHVPDLSVASDYRATVSAAAMRDSYQLQSIDEYRAVVEP